MAVLEIKGLRVSVDNPDAAAGQREIPILNGVDLSKHSAVLRISA